MEKTYKIDADFILNRLNQQKIENELAKLQKNKENEEELVKDLDKSFKSLIYLPFKFYWKCDSSNEENVKKIIENYINGLSTENNEFYYTQEVNRTCYAELKIYYNVNIRPRTKSVAPIDDDIPNAVSVHQHFVPNAIPVNEESMPFIPFAKASDKYGCYIS